LRKVTPLLALGRSARGPVAGHGQRRPAYSCGSTKRRG
jgi:hypothetical protein